MTTGGVKDDFYDRLRKDYYACRERDGHVRASFVYRFLAAREPSKNAKRAVLAAERDELLRGAGGDARALSPEDAARVVGLDAAIAAENERACETFFENHGYPVSRTGASEKRGAKRDKALDMIDAFCREQGLRLASVRTPAAGDAGGASASEGFAAAPEDVERLYESVRFDPERRRLFAPVAVDPRTGVMLMVVGVDWLRGEVAREVQGAYAAQARREGADARELCCVFAVVEPEEYIPEEVEYIQANTVFLFSVSYNDGAGSVFWDYAPAVVRYDVVRAERLRYFVRAGNGPAPQGCPAALADMFAPETPAFDEQAYERAMADLGISLKKFNS